MTTPLLVEEAVHTRKEKTYIAIYSDAETASVALIKPVDERQQVIATSRSAATHREPEGSVLHGVIAAIREVEEMTGHDILSPDGDLIRDTRLFHRGVDACVVSAAPHSPLRVLLMATKEDDPALHSVRRVLASLGGQDIGTWHAEARDSWQEEFDRFFAQAPDVVCITGSETRGQTAALRELTVHLRLALLQFPVDRRPAVVFCGASDLKEAVLNGLGDAMDVHLADQIRPHPRKERPAPLRRVLADLQRDINLSRIAGMDEVVRWTAAKPGGALQALENYVSFRARIQEHPVLSVDWTATSLNFVLARETQTQSAIFFEWGLGSQVGSFIDRLTPQAVIDWLEEESLPTFEQELTNLYRQQGLFPGTIPQEKREAAKWEATLKAVLQQAWRATLDLWGEDDRQTLEIGEMILGGAILDTCPDRRKLLRIFLDGLSPTGTFGVLWDTARLAQGFGQLAVENPLAAVQIGRSATMAPTMWAICPMGTVREGKQAVQITHGDGESQPYLWGSIQAGSLPPRLGVDATIETGRGVNIGHGRGKKRVLAAADLAQGLDFIVDTRGRPIKLARSPQDRRRQLGQWRRELGE